ncbi:ATP-binding protein [Geodermatophilus sp. YIM 151500]|uniref:sensor histidine kinase n=1 Tax=Geodermatophilus sp. YIM 151500 TaxID=2984531 RepID=UPI0021E3FB9C|nr:ATP-binding protein [Geodermatophilus sp. YIM 151500]MCV2490794.1 ATP-binding protein [Geodermatophilus sp. YIM 151500]
MNRLPLRARLTLAFALAMAVVLGAAGVFVQLRLADTLLDREAHALDVRAEALAAELGDAPLPGSPTDFAQFMDPRGRVVAATPGFEQPLFAPADVAGAEADDPLVVEADVQLPDDDEAEPVLLRAGPAAGGVLVVGSSLEERADALDDLRTQMLVGGPVALLLASGAGWLLAGAALRPVEAMRRRAAAISADSAGERLPVPPSRDEVYRLGTTLNAMLDRLDAGLRRERRFVADASHELRTPLALLRAELDLALRRPRSSEELTAALRSAAGDVDRLTRLAEDLLALAGGEEGSELLRAEPVAVPDLLHAIAGRFAARAATEGRTVLVEPGDGAVVRGDRLRLEQALSNLVDNALRHGGGRVLLSASAEDGAVLVSVRDEGPGFGADFLPHAFERFSRAERSRTSSGAGLGLAIVELTARAHGGEVRAGDDPAGGAVVTMRLPAAR